MGGEKYLFNESGFFHCMMVEGGTGYCKGMANAVYSRHYEAKKHCLMIAAHLDDFLNQ